MNSILYVLLAFVPQYFRAFLIIISQFYDGIIKWPILGLEEFRSFL